MPLRDVPSAGGRRLGGAINAFWEILQVSMVLGWQLGTPREYGDGQVGGLTGPGGSVFVACCCCNK